MNEQLFNSVLKESILSEEHLLEIDSYLYSLSNNVLSKKDRARLLEYREKLDPIPSPHLKKKAIVLYHLKQLGSFEYEDYSNKLSQRQKKYLNSLTKSVLEAKRVLVTSLDKELLDTVVDILNKEDIDISTLTINKLYDILISKNIEYILDNINLYKYNNIDISISKDRRSIRGEHKGGGDLITFYANTNDSHLEKVSYLLKVLKQYVGSHYLLTNTYSNIDTLSSKITSFLVHLHYSDDNAPIPRKFLEYNGYELLTSSLLINLSSEEERSHSSLYVLQELGFINVVPPSSAQCREYSLLPLGEAIVGGLSLLYKGKYPSTELILKPGDLTDEYKDYQYYSEVEGFYPDREAIDHFLSTLKASSINLTDYVKEFSEHYPIVKMSKEEYKSLLLSNLYSINNNMVQDFSVLRNFDRDLNLVTSGVNINSLLQGKFRNKIISYENVWRLSYTGRLFQRQGLQGITRKSKSIIHRNYINYDIPNSQITILTQLIEDIYNKYKDEFSEEDLINYRSLSFLKQYNELKESIIESIGVSSREWKECLYAVVFGANINNLHDKTKLGRILFYNQNNPNFNKELFLNNLISLAKPISLWYKYQKRYVEDFQMTPLRSAKFSSVFQHEDSSSFVFNGLNYISKPRLLIKPPPKITAYFLQGIESSFILCLISLLPGLSISYEFDGLVVNKEIHSEIIQEARNRSGFREGSVVVKDFL